MFTSGNELKAFLTIRANNGSLISRRLAKEAGISPSAAASAVTRLISKGFVGTTESTVVRQRKSGAKTFTTEEVVTRLYATDDGQAAVSELEAFAATRNAA